MTTEAHGRSTWYWRLLATAKRGLPLAEMRRLYKVTVLPIMSYACAAWFLHIPPSDLLPREVEETLVHHLPPKALATLRRFQYTCVRAMSSAHDKSPQLFLERELELEDITTWLWKTATVRRSSVILNKGELETRIVSIPLLCTKKGKKKIVTESKGLTKGHPNPYMTLGELCKTDIIRPASTHFHASLERPPPPGSAEVNLELFDNDPKLAKRWIKKRANDLSASVTSAIWERNQVKWQAARRKAWKKKHGTPWEQNNNSPPVLPIRFRGPWDSGLLSIYKGLDRAQSTMLVRLRSGNILLNQRLHLIKVKSMRPQNPFPHNRFFVPPPSHVFC